MKKLSPERVKGLKAEERFLRIARGVSVKTSWIRKIKKAGSKLDHAGVDFVFFILDAAGHLIKVPFQVKSSRYHAEVYSKRHPACVAYGVPVVIVNGDQTDESIAYRIEHELMHMHRTCKNFQGFFGTIQRREYGRAERNLTARAFRYNRMKLFEREHDLLKGIDTDVFFPR